MSLPPESEEPSTGETAARRRAELAELEDRCAELENRLAASEAERSRTGSRLDSLQGDFDRMESQLLSILSSRAFRYSRGARRLWLRIKGS